MPLHSALRELQLLVRSRYGVIFLDAHQEERTSGLLSSLAAEEGLPLFSWSLTRGLCAEGRAQHERGAPLGRTPGAASVAAQGNGIYGTQTLEGALDHLRGAEIGALYSFEGLESFLPDVAVQARLLEVARKFSRTNSALVVLAGKGQLGELSSALQPHCAVFQLQGPHRDEYRTLLERVYRDLARGLPLGFELTPQDTERLLDSLRGFSLLEAEKVLTRVMLEDGRLGPEDIGRVTQAKRMMVERGGLLEYTPATETLSEVAGLTRLKDWLGKRTRLFERPAEARAFGLSFPRGLLLMGVPGVGKSLAAKAVAAQWGLPLLRMDTGALYSKYIGETERNFTRAMRAAEQLSPAVLWIDEIEKAFSAGGEADGGASQRALGAFLSWLQDRSGEVFVVATANDLSRVPPELLRKGRFDELFFLDLPGARVREEILRIHLRRRGHDPSAFDLSALARESEHFSGAELEAAVVAALYTAFAGDAPLSTALLRRELSTTRPLALTRAEDLQALRLWARERAVDADGEGAEETGHRYIN